MVKYYAKTLKLDELTYRVIMDYAKKHRISIATALSRIIDQYLHGYVSQRTRNVIRQYEILKLEILKAEYETMLKAYEIARERYKELMTEIDMHLEVMKMEELNNLLYELYQIIDEVGFRPDMVRSKASKLLADIGHLMKTNYNDEFDLDFFMREIWLKDLPPEEYIYRRIISKGGDEDDGA